MKQRQTAILVTALLLMIIASSVTTVPKAVTAQTQGNTTNWWNNSFEFRRPITVSNDGSSPIANQTVFLRLNFTGFDAEDPNAGVRVVTPSGEEVPSAVMGAQYSGPYLRSVYILFQASIPPKSSLPYYIYYGSALTPVPGYRSVGPTNSIVSGFVSTTLEPISRDSNRVKIEFGTIDSETSMSAVSYASSGIPQKYGPSTISPVPFSNDTGLITAAQLSPQTSVSFQQVQAGTLQLTRILVVSSSSVQTIDALANFGTGAVTGIDLTSVVGLDGLSSLGSSNSVYSSSTGLLYTQNPDAYFGVQQSTPVSSFTLGPAPTVTAEALSGKFAGVSSYSMAGAAGFTWQLGDLSPYHSVWISSAWGVALNRASLGGILPAAPVSATVGDQEELGVATPTARTLWYSTVDFTNQAIPSGTLTLPLALGGAELIPGASSVVGTYSYTVPPSPQQNPQAWTQSSTASGNATSFASPQYYAFDLGTSVLRVAGTVPNSASTATSSLISLPSYAFKGTNAVLHVKYKASYIINAGTLSSQNLFIAADLDPTLTNNYNETILLPLSGSSTTIPQSGCPPSSAQGTTFETVTPSAFLVGDGTWRTLSVDLPASLQPSGFNLILRSCLSTSPGFSGELDLEVASVGIVLVGQASELIGSSFSQAPTQLSVALLPQTSLLSAGGIAANLTVTLVSQLNSSIGWADTSNFSGTLASPPPATVGNPAFGPVETSGEPRFGGILLDSAVSNLTETGQFNGAPASISLSPGIALLGGGLTSGPVSGVHYTVGLRSEPVSVAVQDQDKNGVPGVALSTFVDGRGIPVKSVTNSSGVAKFQMVPWTFQINATYAGTHVGETQVDARSQESATITANLYSLALLVKDSRGGALSGAQVTLQFGNFSLAGQTDDQGRYAFEAIPNSFYNLTIGVGGGTYFSGQVGTGDHLGGVVVTTTYFPPSLQLSILLLIAVVPVALIVAFLAARRLGKRQ